MATPESTLIQGKVNVKWGSSNSSESHQRGHRGRMDLVAVEASTGGYYQPEWLPVLKVTKEEQREAQSKHISVGDRVKIIVTVSQLKEKQMGHGGWTPSMEKVLI